MNIRLVKTLAPSVIAFEENEWEKADIEHYGKPMDMTKRKYKLVATNSVEEVTGTIDISIEVNVAFIEGLLVGSKFRRMGVGKSLVKKAEQLAKEKGCTKIWLETNEGWAAEEFYKQSGYTITGKHEKHIMNQDSLIFTKFF